MAANALFCGNKIKISHISAGFGEANSFSMVDFGLTSCYKSVKEADGR